MEADISQCGMVDDGIGKTNLTGKTNLSKPEKEKSLSDAYVRNAGGRFGVGNKGGPGRRPGSLSAAGRFRQRIAEEHGDELLDLALQAVRSGNANSLLSTMLTFIAGTAKAETAPIVLPAAQHGTYEQRTEAISQAMLAGEISPDAAKIAIEQLKTSEEARQLRELNEELRGLKARLVNGTATRIE